MRSPLSNIANTVGSFFNRSSVSSSVFTGQGVDNSQQFVAQTQQFIQNQNQTQQVLTTVQQQIIGLQQQVQLLSQGLEKVATLLQQDTTQEQNLLNQEEENKRRNLIQKTRTDRESAIESSIQNALITPVQRATEKVQGFFGRIGDALRIMFLGFLGVQALKFLKALKEDDEKTMGEIKDLVLKNITYALGAFAAWKLGLPLLNQALKGMVGKLKDIILGGLRTVFSNAFNAIRNMFGGLKPPSLGAQPGAKPPAAATPKGTPPPATTTPTTPKAGTPPPATTTPTTPKAGTPPPTAGTPKGGKPTATPAPGTGIGSRLMRAGGRLLAPVTGLLSFFGRKEEGQSNVQAGSGALSEVGGASVAASGAATAAAPLLAGGPIGIGAYGLTVLGAGIAGGLAGGRVSDYFTGAGEENRQEGQKATLDGKPVVWSKEKNDWVPDPNAPQAAQVTPTQTMTGESLSPQKEKTSAPTAVPDVSDQAKVTPTETMTGQQMSNEKLKEPSDSNAPFLGKPDSLKPLESSTKEDTKSSLAQMSAPSEQMAASGIPGAPNAFNISSLPVSAMSPTQDKVKTAGMIPPLEEPTPNVIVNTIPVGKEGPLSGTPPSSDVPHINSSNSDNFYVLYSKLNYNVVV
jgi:hypothetical protein